MSVADAEYFDAHVTPLKAKVRLEVYLRASGVPFSILRSCAFFENLDDPANWNPLKKGVVKFLSLDDCKYCATYDIGRAAAVQLQSPQAWLGKTLDVIGWQGDLAAVAAAMAQVSGVPVQPKLAMPLFLRRLFFKDLHHMFLYYELQKGPRGTPEDFKKVVPDALSAQDWFRFHGRYTNGEKLSPQMAGLARRPHSDWQWWPEGVSARPLPAPCVAWCWWSCIAAPPLHQGGYIALRQKPPVWLHGSHTQSISFCRGSG